MPIVTVFGGSGFIGRYAARKLAKRGWRVRVAVRRPNEALFLRPMGDVGQVEPIQANIRDEASTRRAIEGSDAVINFVGVLFNQGQNTFEATQAEGAARIARICAECGISRLVHVSALGASAESESQYARSKAAGEAAVLKAVPSATILRPSVVFGVEDQFFNRFAGMATLSPVLPVVHGDTRFQPVYVDDVAEAAVRALNGQAAGKILELGGPEVFSYRDLMRRMLRVIRRNAWVVGLPLFVARAIAWWSELFGKFGLKPLLTRDQIKLLETDNVVSEDNEGFAALGMIPRGMGAILPSYLYRFRPYGQYARLTEHEAEEFQELA